jgi:hypothetical protein
LHLPKSMRRLGVRKRGIHQTPPPFDWQMQGVTQAYRERDPAGSWKAMSSSAGASIPRKRGIRKTGRMARLVCISRRYVVILIGQGWTLPPTPRFPFPNLVAGRCVRTARPRSRIIILHASRRFGSDTHAPPFYLEQTTSPPKHTYPPTTYPTTWPSQATPKRAANHHRSAKPPRPFPAPKMKSPSTPATMPSYPRAKLTPSTRRKPRSSTALLAPPFPAQT